MPCVEDYPVVLRCDGLRARPSAVQLVANGVWRVDWVGGLVSLYREDPRHDLELGYEPKHLRWWLPASERGREKRAGRQPRPALATAASVGADRATSCPASPLPQLARSLSLVSSDADACSRGVTGDATHENVDPEFDLVVVLGSGVDCEEEFLASLEARPDADVTFDNAKQAAALDQSAVIERMADVTMRLARRNEALEDFAALVAHELKSPLETALLADEPRRWIDSALDLVESLLQAATESPDGGWASLSDCLAKAAYCLDPIQFTVAGEEDIRFPLPARSLSVILRNLLANAAAAQARRVEVFTTHRDGEWSLVVDDDGVGLGVHEDHYEHGSGVGLELCRRIAGRSGGRLELVPRSTGGTRAILTLERAA